MCHIGLRGGVLRRAGGLQELAEEAGGHDAMHSSRKGSKARGATKGAPKAAAVSGDERLYLLALREQHRLDVPDARQLSSAAADEFAGMQQTGGKGRWIAPPLPMCAARPRVLAHGCGRSAFLCMCLQVVQCGLVFYAWRALWALPTDVGVQVWRGSEAWMGHRGG